MPAIFPAWIGRGIVGIRGCDIHGLPHVQELNGEPLSVPPCVADEHKARIDKWDGGTACAADISKAQRLLLMA
jgi:hypothetical protein